MTVEEIVDFPDTYQALRAALTVDYLDIDNEIMKLPQQVQEAAELAFEAANDEAACKMAHDVVKAETANSLREANERITEAAIERQLPLFEDVQNARMAHARAEAFTRLCQELVRSLRVKSLMLQKASEMIVSGYMTPSAAYERRREEIHQARTAKS